MVMAGLQLQDLDLAGSWAIVHVKTKFAAMRIDRVHGCAACRYGLRRGQRRLAVCICICICIRECVEVERTLHLHARCSQDTGDRNQDQEGGSERAFSVQRSRGKIGLRESERAGHSGGTENAKYFPKKAPFGLTKISLLVLRS
jgi:hypothetical protein